MLHQILGCADGKKGKPDYRLALRKKTSMRFSFGAIARDVVSKAENTRKGIKVGSPNCVGKVTNVMY